MTDFSTSVANSSDDAQETGGTNVIDGATLNANFTTQLFGLRFENVTIPAGSTITNASITLNFTSTSYDSPNCTIRGGGEANGSTFTTDSNHLTNRTKTSASVSWVETNLGAGTQPTPDLSDLVEEIIAIPGWSSGNAMLFYFSGNVTANSIRVSSADSADPPATLNIAYTAPSGSAHSKVSRHHLGSKVGGVLTT